MVAHRRLQHLGRQLQKIIGDFAHQHDRPFHQPRHFGQQPLVLDDLKPLGKGLIGGVIPDCFGPLLVPQNDMRPL